MTAVDSSGSNRSRSISAFDEQVFTVSLLHADSLLGPDEAQGAPPAQHRVAVPGRGLRDMCVWVPGLFLPGGAVGLGMSLFLY